MPDLASEIELSIIAPAHNEEDNIAELTEQIGRAIEPLGIAFEFIVVDDGSTDSTLQRTLDQARDKHWVRAVTMERTPPGSGNGQSAAFHQGFRHARGRLVATLDADLQNDPADFVKMLEILRDRPEVDFVQGDRSEARREGDSWIRQFGSIVGRTFRRMILGDTIRDTGCSLRIMRREIALKLPLEFKGAHRFIPVTARQLGYTVVEMPVAHRARHAGEPKYGMGITKRAIPGLIDCFAIRWMGKRRRPTESREADATENTATPVVESREQAEPVR